MNAKKTVLLTVPFALLLFTGLLIFLRQAGNATCEDPFIRIIAASSRTLQDDPENLGAFTNRANAYYTLGWYNLALPDYTEAINRGATNGALFLNRAKCFDLSKDMQSAIQDAERAVELRPDDPACYLRLGDIYRIQKEYEKALPHYQHGLKLAPDDADLHTGLARSYAAQKDYAAAERSFNTAVACEPHSAFALYRRGIFFASQHKYQQAVDDFTRFIGTAPTCRTRWLQARAYTRRHAAAQEGGISGYGKAPLKTTLLNLKIKRIHQKTSEAREGKSALSTPLLLGYTFLLLGLMSSFFLVIGIYVVAKKKPILLSSRWFFGFIAVAFSFQIINTIAQLCSTHSGGLFFALGINVLMYVLLLGFLWIQMKGYILIGIYDDSFREALHFSLQQNHLPFEERLSNITLTEEKAELQIAIQSWVGTGQIKQKKPVNLQLLTKIMGGIEHYYSENAVKLNYITPVFYLIFGLLLLVLAIVIAILFLLI